MIQSFIFNRDVAFNIERYTHMPVEHFEVARHPDAKAIMSIDSHLFKEGDTIVFVDGYPKYEHEVTMNVVVINDYSGDWQELYINGVLINENHSIDLMYYLNDYLNGYEGNIKVSFENFEKEDNDQILYKIMDGEGNVDGIFQK